TFMSRECFEFFGSLKVVGRGATPWNSWNSFESVPVTLLRWECIERFGSSKMMVRGSALWNFWKTLVLPI
ncbi:unnamed protein product, partial [Ceratitis capitata]